jgi:hypothetical protein
MLLILTSKTDLTADFLIVELIRRRAPFFRVNTEDLAEADFYFELDGAGITKQIAIGPRVLNLVNVTAVWYRRAIHPVLTTLMPSAERIFVTGELRHAAIGLLLNPGIIWVNPIDKVSIAEHKLYQLQVARKLGFSVPRTVVSRDPQTLNRFICGNVEGTICKPIFHGLFRDQHHSYSVYTRRVESSVPDDASVRICPVLLQEEIPRLADVRATFIGDKTFVVDITGEAGLVDWRDPNTPTKYAVSHLPASVEAMCRAMLQNLGLIYGAFDFIKTDRGEFIFLEVNPTGEWAWLENELGMPMRDAFIELFFPDST